MPVFAAVDIGSNSVRLSIAELRRGRLLPVHQDREVTRLGEGVFKDRSLTPQAMAASLKVLRRFYRAAQSFAVERIRVVATSALRDSDNGHIFAEWVKSATGWNLEIISGLEEGRLIHLGVVASMRRPLRMLLIDLGGGSCEVTLSDKGHIKEMVTLPLGAVRLTQEFIHSDPPSKEELNRLREFIAEETAHLPRQLARSNVELVIATSGSAAALSGAAQSLGLAQSQVSRETIATLAKRLAKLTMRERAAIKGINTKRAEIVIAGAAVYAHIMEVCGLRSFRYSQLGLRDGILAQMAAEFDEHTRSHQQLEADRRDILLNISRRYGSDLVQVEHVRGLAWSLFDQTRSMHQLSNDFREWIGAAAMLYEVGTYINPVGRHRHAYYIVGHSELFGFTPLQRKIIATIARYQGNSRPELRDRLVKLLPAPLRSDVIKATALLRVARALNQGRREAVQSIRATQRDGQLIVSLQTRRRASVDLELWAGEKEVAYFREVFGRELSLRLA